MAELTEALGIPALVAQRVVAWVQAGGWHATSGLPKPQELAVTAGSAYIIPPERFVGDSALATLAARGLELRRHEGFGDLAPPPILRGGAVAQQREAERRTRLRNRAATRRRQASCAARAVTIPTRTSARRWTSFSGCLRRTRRMAERRRRSVRAPGAARQQLIRWL